MEEEIEIPFNAGDADAVRSRKISSKERQRQSDAMLAAIMDTAQGRIWMWDLLEISRVFHSSFSSRALEMAFAEGQRNLGLRLMADLMRVCPDLYTKMARENGGANERSSNDSRA